MSDGESAKDRAARSHLRVLTVFSGCLGGLVAGIVYVLVVLLPMAAQIREAHPNYYDPTVVIAFAFVFAGFQGALYGLISSLTASLLSAAVVRASPSLALEILATIVGTTAGLGGIYLVFPPALETFRLAFVAIAGVAGVTWFVYLTTLSRKVQSRAL